MAHHHERKGRWRRLGACLIAAAAAGIMVAAPAQAQPSASQIEAQIAAADNQLESIVEDYNRIHSELAANKRQVVTLEAKLRPLQLQVSVAQSHLGTVADQVYRAGPVTTWQALLGTASASDMLAAQGYADQEVRQRRADIHSVVALRDRYAAEEHKFVTLNAGLKTQDAQLASHKSQIQTRIASLQALRRKVGASTAPHGDIQPVACPYTYSGGKGGTAARRACSVIGKPYVWAAAGPNSFDCSGLTLWAWAGAGVTLRHYTKWQWADTTAVSRADLRPGDLVFYFPPSLHHVALYVGGGWVVNAPDTGNVVRMAKVGFLPIAGYRRPA